MEMKYVKSVQCLPQLLQPSLPPHQRSVSSNCADTLCFCADLADTLQQQHRTGLLSAASSRRPINNHHFAQNIRRSSAAMTLKWLLSAPVRELQRRYQVHCQIMSDREPWSCALLCSVGWQRAEMDRYIYIYILFLFFFFWLNLCFACKISRARCEINIFTLLSFGFSLAGGKWTPLSPLPPCLVTWLMLL